MSHQPSQADFLMLQQFARHRWGCLLAMVFGNVDFWQRQEVLDVGLLLWPRGLRSRNWRIVCHRGMLAEPVGIKGVP